MSKLLRDEQPLAHWSELVMPMLSQLPGVGVGGVGDGGVSEGGAMVGAEVLDPTALQTGVACIVSLGKHEHTPSFHWLMNWL